MIFNCTGPRASELSGLWTPLQQPEYCMRVGKEGKGSPSGPVNPIPTLVSSVGVQKTWRQPRKGRPLYIWDMMLLDLAINRVIIFCLKLLLDVNPPPLSHCTNCVYCVIVSYIVFPNITAFRLGHNSFIHSYLSIYRLLLKQGSESYDSHWLPYHLQCSPCQVEQPQQ